MTEEFWCAPSLAAEWVDGYKSLPKALGDTQGMVNR
jgi:hypothetical protein